MEADMGMTDMAFNSGQQAGDDQLLVKFYMHPKKMQQETEQQGRPIFKDTEYIEIRQPGDKDNVRKRPARTRDKDRFPEHYRKFKARESQVVEGTPLSEVPWLTRSQVEELKWMSITTVEHLAILSDANAQKVMGFSLLKKKAQSYMDKAQKDAKDADLEKKLAQRDEQIAALTKRLDEMESAAPELTQGQKAAATRARNKAAKEAEEASKEE